MGELGPVVQVALFVAFPALAIWGAERSRLLDALSPVVLCYLFGIALVNLGVGLDARLSHEVASAAVPLAIPLLLFGLELRRWFRLAPRAALSFLVAVLSVMLVAGGLAWLWRDHLPEYWKLAGMVVGVYTGGTPNMSAVGLALGVAEENFVLLNAADVFLGGLYFVGLLTVVPRLVRRWLPPFPDPEGLGKEDPAEEVDPGPVLRRAPGQVLAALLVSALCVGAGVGVSLLLRGRIDPPVVILVLTTAGVLASLVPRVRALEGSYETGQYLLLIFCVAIGSLADVQQLAAAFSGVFYYLMAVLVGTILLHFLGARLLGIDADTAIITSTAAVFGPPFVGPVAAALRNREVVASGLTTGVVGYAVGNYLGLLVAWLVGP